MPVGNACPTVRVSVSEGAIIVDTGSDNCDTQPVTDTERRMYAGKISVAVKAGEGMERLELYAEADGLATAVAEYDFEN